MIDLPGLVGRLVRVGGLVTDLRPDGVVLDDGTAAGRLVFRGAAAELLALLEPDDAINAIGRVEQLEQEAVVVVEDAAGIIRAGDPEAPDAVLDQGSGETRVETAADQASKATLAGLPTDSWLGAGAVGFATLSLLSAASLTLTFLRRRHARRRLSSRIAARLATFEQSSPSTIVPSSSERGRNPFHSA
jgi:hypothetical protein